MDDEPISDIEFIRGTLYNALASGLTLADVIKAYEHADCIVCADEAVALLGIGAIDPGEYTFEFTLR